MKIETLHETSMLAYVSVRVWAARKLDRKATKRLTDESSATADAARVNKYLMSAADEKLRGIQKIARRARDTLVAATLPWDEAGNRLISNLDTFQLLGDLYAIEQEFDAAVNDFCTDYPQLRDISLQALGDMADIEDYPSVEVVRSKFSMKNSLTPLPAGFGDVRVGLTDEQQEALRKHYEAQAAERFEDATRSGWERLQSNVERYVDRLALTADGKNKAFQSTMVEQLRDTVALLKNLNVFNNPDLERFRFQIEETLCKHDPEVLRNSIQAAQTTHKAAQGILDKLNAMLAP